MVTPPFLKSGDAVGVVSTARKISSEELSHFLQLLESWGLHPVLGKTINTEDYQYAGDDALRTQDFQEMLDNPKIKAIWCARGGYGTVRIVDELDFHQFREHPKWIVGYSDVTVLHAHIHQFNIETLHANMALGLDVKTDATTASIKKVLFGKEYSISFSSEENKLNRMGIAKGQLIGGNLSVLYSLLGSLSELKTEGNILFIEDLDEMLYHIDRMMVNLKRIGLLKNLSGIIVGGMNDMRDNAIPFGKTAEEIIEEAVSEYNFPVVFNFPAGHIHDNRALIMGREVCLDVGSNEVSLKF